MNKDYVQKLLELIKLLNNKDYILSDSEGSMDWRIICLFNTVGANSNNPLNNDTVRKWCSRKNIPKNQIIIMRDSMNDSFDKLRNRIIDINGYNAVRIYKKLIDDKQIPADKFREITVTKDTTMELCASILTIYFYFCVISSLNNNESDINELVRKYELTVKQPDIESFLKKYSVKLAPYNNSATNDNTPISDIIDIYVHSIDVNEEELTINDLLRDTSKNRVVLIGQSGSGKTYSLKSFAAKQGEGKYIYIPLEKYKIYKTFDLKSTSDWIIFYIISKCLLDDNYFYSEQILLEHKEFISQLIEEFCKCPYNGTPNYTLLLDDFNNIYPEYKECFIQELTIIIKKWINVRLIITVNDKSDADSVVFSSFKYYMITGIKNELQKVQLKPLFDDKTFEILKEFKSSEVDVLMPSYFYLLKELGYDAPKGMKELLKLPLINNLYLKNNNESLSFGEVFNNCITNYPGNATIRFILQIVMPFLAKRGGGSFSRISLLDTIDKAIEIYIHNERVFQGFFKNLNIPSEAILKSRNNEDWVDIILNKFPFIEKDSNNSFSFIDRLLTNCFKAKHIVNAINALACVKDEELSELFSQLNIDDHWFGSSFLIDFAYDDFELAKLIGEISEDYKGNYSSKINKLLDQYRKVNLHNGAANVLNLLQISRDKKIDDVDFSSLFFMYIPSYCEYHNCNFSDCFIAYLPIIDYEGNYIYTYTQDDSLRIIIIENSCGPDIYIWDIKNNKLIDHYNYNEYSDNCCYYFTEFYKGADNTIILLSDSHVLFFEYDIENHKGNITGYINSSDPKYEVFQNHYLEHKDDFPDLSDEFLEEVVTSYNIFHSCDFGNIKLLDEEQLRLLKKMVEKDENEAWPDKLSSYFQNN